MGSVSSSGEDGLSLFVEDFLALGLVVAMVVLLCDWLVSNEVEGMGSVSSFNEDELSLFEEDFLALGLVIAMVVLLCDWLVSNKVEGVGSLSSADADELLLSEVDSAEDSAANIEGDNGGGDNLAFFSTGLDAIDRAMLQKE